MGGDCYLVHSFQVRGDAEGMVGKGEYRAPVDRAVGVLHAIYLHGHPDAPIGDLSDLHTEEACKPAGIAPPHRFGLGLRVGSSAPHAWTGGTTYTPVASR